MVAAQPMPATRQIPASKLTLASSGSDPLAPGSSARSAPGLAYRVALLAACVALGCAIGLLGQWLTGRSVWFVAIPVCVALAWFLVADPTACSPRHAKQAPDGATTGPASLVAVDPDGNQILVDQPVGTIDP